MQERKLNLIDKKTGSKTWTSYPTFVEDVEDFIAELGVQRVGSALFVSEQSLQQSRKLVDVQRIVPEIEKKRLIYFKPLKAFDKALNSSLFRLSSSLKKKLNQ